MTTAGSLDDYLRARRAEVDEALVRWLPAPPGTPAVVAGAMRYSIEAGGKRLRPVLCLAAADAVAAVAGTPGSAALALPAACAIEFIHTYSLIHDDLPAMDDDTLRRGKPTLHVVAGEGMAILAGDGLLTEAFALLAREPQGDDPALLARRLRTIGLIAEAAGAAGMVGGQALDLSMDPGAAATGIDASALDTMHAKKTGALITAAASAGAIMAGGSDAEVAAIRQCGARFGLAFQIVDDILDVEGASADLGKTAGKDAAAGKPTYPALYGLAESRRMAQACIDEAAAGLAGAGFGETRLLAIGRWIVDRTH